MRPIRLSNEEIIEKLIRLPGWTRSDEVIKKTYEFTTFVSSLGFVNQLAEAAEEVQHHPDIDIRYNKVTVTLTTHDAGGLTENDFNFATFADGLADATIHGGTD